MVRVGRFAAGPAACATAPLANDKSPAAPKTGTALLRRFRFETCFACNMRGPPSRDDTDNARLRLACTRSKCQKSQKLSVPRGGRSLPPVFAFFAIGFFLLAFELALLVPALAVERTGRPFPWLRLRFAAPAGTCRRDSKREGRPPDFLLNQFWYLNWSHHAKNKKPQPEVEAFRLGPFAVDEVAGWPPHVIYFGCMFSESQSATK
jgi:hypothetical protein